MPKLRVGRIVQYEEVFEIDTNKLASIRDDLNLCEHMLYAADPVLSQQLKSFTEDGISAVKFIGRVMNCISENPIYPASKFAGDKDEACRLIEETP